MELDFASMRHCKKHLKHAGGAPLAGRLSTPLKKTTRSSGLAAAGVGLVGLAQGAQGGGGGCSREPPLKCSRQCVCPPAGGEAYQVAQDEPRRAGLWGSRQSIEVCVCATRP